MVRVIEKKIFSVRDLLGCRAIEHDTCIGYVHEKRMGHAQATCTGIAQATCMGIARGQQHEERDFSIFLGMFFNGWILIWEYPYHIYEFQISKSLFYNGF